MVHPMSMRKLTRAAEVRYILSSQPARLDHKCLKEEMYTYDIVIQPTGGNAVPNDQQHIYDRTQHPGIGDKTQQTHDECNQGNTTDRGQYEHVDNIIDKEAETRKQSLSDIIMIQSQSQRKKSTMGRKLCLPRRTLGGPNRREK